MLIAATTPALDARIAADVALAERCRHDSGAREELCREHAAALHRLCYRLTGDPIEAEDLLQDVFIEILGSLVNYRGEAPLSAWMRRITVRTAMHGHRRRRRQPQLMLVEDEAAPPTDPGAAIDSRAALQRIRKHLEQLADTTRIAFLLFQVEGYSISETAALLDLSETAAKKRIWRARKDLERRARKDQLLASFLTLPRGET